MPRCRNCKEKFEPKFPLQKFCFNSDECREAASQFALEKVKQQKKKDWNKKKREIKESLKRKQDYEKDLEKLVNKYVRIRDKDKPCISCGKSAGTYTITAGHYYPAGSYKNIRFHLDNIHAQCWWDCNKNKSGNLIEYRKGLVKRIGEEAVLKLDEESKKPSRFTIPELKEMIEYYKQKIKEQ